MLHLSLILFLVPLHGRIPLLFRHYFDTYIQHKLTVAAFVTFSTEKMGRRNLNPIQFAQSFLSSIIITTRDSKPKCTRRKK